MSQSGLEVKELDVSGAGALVPANEVQGPTVQALPQELQGRGLLIMYKDADGVLQRRYSEMGMRHMGHHPEGEVLFEIAGVANRAVHEISRACQELVSQGQAVTRDAVIAVLNAMRTAA